MNGRTGKHDVYKTTTFNRSCNVLKVNPSGKNSIRCQTYANTEDHIELKRYFNSRHPRHRFSAQRKMQHLRIFNEEIHAFEDWIFCQIIRCCSCFWMDHKPKQVYSLIDRFRSIYDVRRYRHVDLPFTPMEYGEGQNSEYSVTHK